MKPISIDEFFEEKLVENLAALLGIDKSKIRVMNVISAGGARRRRAVQGPMVVDIEIGDPPAANIEYDEGDIYDNSTVTNTTEGVASNYTGWLAVSNILIVTVYISGETLYKRISLFLCSKMYKKTI